MRTSCFLTGKFPVTLILMLLVACSVQSAPGEIKIPRHCRTPNPGAYCGHAVTETLACHAGYKGLKGMTEGLHRKGAYGPSRMSDWRRELDGIHATYNVKTSGAATHAWVKSELRKGRPVEVSLRPRAGDQYGHVVAVVGYQKNAVKLFDPDRSRVTRTMTLQNFNRRWDKNGIAVHARAR